MSIAQLWQPLGSQDINLGAIAKDLVLLRKRAASFVLAVLGTVKHELSV
jgi:hypothetical protein